MRAPVVATANCDRYSVRPAEPARFGTARALETRFALYRNLALSKLNTMLEDPVLDRTYAALADSTRRALLVALRAGESRITDLAAPFPMTFAGVSRHIGVLEAAGLVTRSIRGREHWLSLQPAALDPAERW